MSQMRKGGEMGVRQRGRNRGNGNPPFRVMCDMWGAERAIEVCNAMGVKISKEEKEEALRKEELWLKKREEAVVNLMRTMEGKQDA